MNNKTFFFRWKNVHRRRLSHLVIKREKEIIQLLHIRLSLDCLNLTTNLNLAIHFINLCYIVYYYSANVSWNKLSSVWKAFKSYMCKTHPPIERCVCVVVVVVGWRGGRSNLVKLSKKSLGHPPPPIVKKQKWSAHESRHGIKILTRQYKET